MTTDRLAGETAAAPAPEAGQAPAAGNALTPPSAAGDTVPGAPPADALAASGEPAGARDSGPGGVGTGGGPSVPGEGSQPPESAPSAAGETPPAAAPGESSGCGSGGDSGKDGTGGSVGGPEKQSGAAAALAAAVRAVESGERPAASFFNEPAKAAPRREAERGRAVAAPARQGGPAAGSVPAGGPGAPGAQQPTPGARLPTADRAAHTAAVREVLAEGGAPETLAEAVVDTLGERAAEAVREDPWQLLAVPGVRPEQADGFARALLGPEAGPGDERRTQALVGLLLEQAALKGHTALEPAALSAALAQHAVPDPQEALSGAIADGGVLVFQDALDTPGAAAAAPSPAAEDGGEGEGEEQPVRVLLGLDRYALAEESLADGLARALNTFAPEGTGTADGSGGAGADSDDGTGGTGAAPHAPTADDWRAAAAAAPSPSAAELIRAVAGSGLVAHTGGEAARAEPAALVAAARALGLRAYAAVHSQDGARRLAALLAGVPGGPAGPAEPESPAGAGSVTPTPGGAEGSAAPEGDSGAETHDGAGGPVVTVAGLLAGTEGPGRDAEGAFALDLLVVLDAPQLDVETAAMLVESLPDGARLVLSGDPGVLWSAGPGKVFADLLAARACPQVVSRTPDPGPLGELVSGIGIGELNQVDAPGKEVVIVPVRDPGEAVHRTVQLVADSVPRAIGVPPELTQVITPGHGGAAGTRVLNAAMKERLNPGPGRFGGFDPGDRVAYVPAPGRLLPGTVVSADAEGLRLDCAGSPVVVPRERVADAVRHAWAVTAHQAAGMRWPAAVVVLPGDAAQSLTRSWIYTAFGRAERHLSVVHGADQALPHAVAEVPVKERTTRLRTLLRTLTPPPA